MNRSTPELRPLELRNHQEGRWLEVVWSDGVTAVLPHRLLREACRCAHCLSAIRSGTAEAVAAKICLELIEPYGPGALRLGFDDGHSRGLYPFEYLRGMWRTSEPWPVQPIRSMPPFCFVFVSSQGSVQSIPDYCTAQRPISPLALSK